VVIFCHGIPGSKPNPDDRGYLGLVEDIVSDGFCCVVFNFRGCGLSSGNIDMRAWFTDLGLVFDKVYNLPGIDTSSIHYIGFSAGGAIASRHACFEKKVQSLLLMATPYSLSDILPDDAYALKRHFLELGTIRDKDFPKDIDSWYQGFKELNTGQWIPFLSPRPVGIVHGDSDEVVPYEHAGLLYESACLPKKITILDGAAHQLRKDPRVSGIIRDWLSKVR